MTEQTIERQHLSSNIEHGRIARENATTELARIAVAEAVTTLLTQRIDSVTLFQLAEGFYKISAVCERKNERRETCNICAVIPDEKGAFLPALHTPLMKIRYLHSRMVTERYRSTSRIQLTSGDKS